MFCYQTAAYRRNDGLGSLITFGSPVDTRQAMPFGLPEQFATGAAELLADALRGWGLPAWASRNGFKLLDPVKSLRHQIEFLLQLHDRQALLPRERQRRFLEGEGWVAWPGPAMADFVRQFIAHNRMLEGGFTIEDRLVTLADIDCPILAVVGTVDEIAPPAGVRAILQAAPRAEVYELTLHAGHFGLVVGSRSTEVTWPAVAGWARWQAGEGEVPGGRRSRWGPSSPELAGPQPGRLRDRARRRGGRRDRAHHGRRDAPHGPRRPGARARGRRPAAAACATGADPAQHPHLAGPAGRGAPAQGARGDVLPVRGPRLHGQGGRRTDRQRRPRADLDRGPPGRARRRADGDAAERARAGGRDQPARRGIGAAADPTATWSARSSSARCSGSSPTPSARRWRPGCGGVHTFVLGGGGGPRELETEDATDMEQIDPAAVTLPRWYRPNPGRAADVAFITFTGEGGRDAHEPDHEPPLGHVGVRHRVLGGADGRRHRLQRHAAVSPVGADDGDRRRDRRRLAPRDGHGVQPGDVLGGGPPLRRDRRVLHLDAAARHRRGAAQSRASATTRCACSSARACRAGSGAASSARFAPARVLEFYASTEAGAILVNLRDVKPGSMGRRLPGSADVRIAAYDVDVGGLELGPDGFARECGGRRGRAVARARQPDRAAERHAAAGRVRARGRVAGHRRSVPPRRRRRLLARRRRQRRRSGPPDGPAFTAPIRDALVRHPGGRSGGRLRGASGRGRGRDRGGSGHIARRAAS